MRKSVFAAPLALAAALCTVPAWSDTLAPGGASAGLEIDDGFVTGLTQPTSFAFLPDGRLVITQKAGLLRVRTAAGALVDAGTFPVDAAGNERGLLNVLPHPNFAENRLLFVYYTAGSGVDPGNRLVSVELGTNNRVDLATENVLVDGLYAEANHNGGALALYRNTLFLGVGDATGPLRATCLTSGNGKILRIDVSGAVPMDNPLVGQNVEACEASSAPRRDIFAWGLRNPWRAWADPKTGNLWVGDVGDGAYEEIDVIPKAGGAHLGWPHREADNPLPGEDADVTACSADDGGAGNCLEPVHTCPHPTCESITGGVILDACEWPAELEGRYVFGDYNTRLVWTLGVNSARTNVVGARVPLAQGEGSGPVHFAEQGGALYTLMFAGNAHITRIAPRTPDMACTGSGGSGTAGTGNTAGTSGTSGTSGGEAGNPNTGGTDGGEAASGGGPATGGRMSGGTAGRAGASSGTGAGPASGSAGTAGADSPNSGGCGCRTGGPARGTFIASVLASLLAFASRRRRRRGARRSAPQLDREDASRK